jgi:hypothetical protein
MVNRINRLEEFSESPWQTLMALLKGGLPRRAAANYLGISPATIAERMARDPLFAADVRQAEMFCQIRLLELMLRHSERSWRAAAWLLERLYPERYAKREPSATSQPDAKVLALRKLVAKIDRERDAQRERGPNCP